MGYRRRVDGLQSIAYRVSPKGEKIGIMSRSREAVLEILEMRFGRIPSSLPAAVNGLEDLATLEDLLKKAVTTDSLEAFEATLKR
jgi:hypothetical protein